MTKEQTEGQTLPQPNEHQADDFAAALEAAKDLETVQNIVTHAVRKLVDAAGATIVFRDGEHCFYADEDSIAPLWKGQRFPIRECVSGWAMLNDRSATVPDIRRDERVPLDAYLPTFVRSLVMVPVGVDEPIAAIGAYWAVRRKDLGEYEVAKMERLARLAAEAIDRIGLENAVWAPTFRLPQARR